MPETVYMSFNNIVYVLYIFIFDVKICDKTKMLVKNIHSKKLCPKKLGKQNVGSNEFIFSLNYFSFLPHKN